MGKKLYVGNLSYGVTDSDLLKMFEAHGAVESAQVIMDRDTGRSKGFGFVEMKNDQEAQAAIAALNGQDNGGRALTVYAQQEVVKDLIQARLAAGGAILFEVSDVGLLDADTSTPRVVFRRNGAADEIACDFIAGCDGYHGVSRASVPEGAIRTFERAYPFGWLGVLVDRPPVADELIYAHHERGFALCSMRSHVRSRYYVQVPAGEKIEAWSDDRFWDELRHFDREYSLSVSITPYP